MVIVLTLTLILLGCGGEITVTDAGKITAITYSDSSMFNNHVTTVECEKGKYRVKNWVPFPIGGRAQLVKRGRHSYLTWVGNRKMHIIVK